MMAFLQVNWMLIVGAIFVLIVLAIVAYELVAKKREPQPAAVPDIFTAPEAAPSPAAPAADSAAPPPAVKSGTPAGSGGASVVVQVTRSDRVAAKHAALDQRIADGKAAEAQKQALLAAEATLDQLTEAA